MRFSSLSQHAQRHPTLVAALLGVGLILIGLLLHANDLDYGWPLALLMLASYPAYRGARAAVPFEAPGPGPGPDGVERPLPGRAADHLDPVTGLPGRRALERRLYRGAEPGGPHTLLYLDLDRFQRVNELCGHAAGDELMRQLAGVIQRRIGACATLTRVGGDELAVLLEGRPLAGALPLAEDLCAAVREHPFAWCGQRLPLGVSIGAVAVDGVHGMDPLSAAQIACQAAKRAGRGRVHGMDDPHPALTERRATIDWASRVHDALTGGGLGLRYQAITPLADEASAALHLEVLLTLRDDTGRTREAAAFVPAAECFGLMPRVDRWVVEETLAHLVDHPEVLARLGLCAINLSATSVSDPGLLDFLLRRLDAHAVPPERLCFEVTETALIGNPQAATRLMDSLRERGCRFALDDFGSGMASFAYLRDLPVDYLKIDGRFVRRMADDPTDCALVKAINEVGHALGKATVAECVEDEESLAALRAMGVDYAQGYILSLPRPLAELGAG